MRGRGGAAAGCGGAGGRRGGGRDAACGAAWRAARRGAAARADGWRRRTPHPAEYPPAVWSICSLSAIARRYTGLYAASQPWMYAAPRSMGWPPISTVSIRPPTRCRASSTTGSSPRSRSHLAAPRPAGPAPITTTRARERADEIGLYGSTCRSGRTASARCPRAAAASRTPCGRAAPRSCTSRATASRRRRPRRRRPNR